MRSRVVQAGPDTVVVAVLDPGDDAVAALGDLARERELASSQLTAVGAFERAVVGWFDRAAKEYRRIPIDEQCEVLSLMGDVAEGADGPQLHMHAVLGLSDGTTRGGHLLEGLVWPTLEVVIRESPTPLHKTNRPDIGLALIDLDADSA